MPKIPGYQRKELPSGQVPSVRGDLATAALVPRAIAGVGEEMQDVGQILAKHAAAKQDQRNNLETLSLWNQWQDKAFTMRQGYRDQKGLKATNIVSEYRTEHEKGFNEFLKEASNNQVKQALTKINSRSRMTGLTGLATYSRAEAERFKGQEFADLTLDARNAVIEDPSDETFAEKAGVGLVFISKNYPGDEAKKAEFYRELLDTRIRGLIDSDPVKAKQLIKDNRVALGDDHETLQTKLESSEKAKEAEVDRQEKLVEKIAKDLKKDYDTKTNNEFYELNRENKLSHSMVEDSELDWKEKKQWRKTIDEEAKDKKIDPIKAALAIIEANNMISKGIDPEEIRKFITHNINLSKEDKEQYINKLGTKLSSEVKEGVKVGYRDISNLIIPKRGITAKILETSLEIQRVTLSQLQLDAWVKEQQDRGKFPTKNEIRVKALELAEANQPTIVEKIEHEKRKAKSQTEEIKAYQKRLKELEDENPNWFERIFD